MCTVTYIPFSNNQFVLTSIRDESKKRKATPPKIYKEGKMEIIYPKDQKAGGTWIAITNRHRAACLLNGAYERHKKLYTYRKSRGLVTLDLIKAKDLVYTVENYDFINIEPFTLIKTVALC